MQDSKYRHKCVRCKRHRSRDFHRRYPAGPGYPSVKGVCRRCREPDEVPALHIHHHHWYVIEKFEDYQTTKPVETLSSSPRKLNSHQRGLNPDLVGLSELPESQPTHHGNDPPQGRAELADCPVSWPLELNPEFIVPLSPHQPLVGPKPRYHRQ